MDNQHRRQLVHRAGRTDTSIRAELCPWRTPSARRLPGTGRVVTLSADTLSAAGDCDAFSTVDKGPGLQGRRWPPGPRHRRWHLPRRRRRRAGPPAGLDLWVSGCGWDLAEAVRPGSGNDRPANWLRAARRTSSGAAHLGSHDRGRDHPASAVDHAHDRGSHDHCCADHLATPPAAEHFDSGAGRNARTLGGGRVVDGCTSHCREQLWARFRRGRL